MSIDPEHNELEKAQALIDELVQVDYGGKRDSIIDLKLDLLERTIELLRIKKRYLKNDLKFEDYIQSNIFCGSDSIHFALPERSDNLGSGTAPIRLQPKLLLFLLIYHREEFRVLDIIEKFIGKIWDYLGTVDFKKTETGVFRCFTNTRFAAKTLREYGLLKFTRKEAFKTWVLSLPGFLVASVVLEKYKDDWQIPTFRRAYNLNLHEDILDAKDRVRTYDDYVKRLAVICEPNTEIFGTFEGVLQEAYSLLNNYWRILENQNKTIVERQKESLKLVQKIEGLPTIEQFYSELSKCINLERLLGEIR
ncbi:hypothetical protein ACFL3Q_03620 [Planctomycetota bacterium]